MFRRTRVGWRATGFTLTDLIVTIGMVVLLALLLAPGIDLVAKNSQRIRCTDQLRSIGRGVAACFEEHNGYGPTHDDGDQTQLMLTWVDLLFDAGYLAFPRQLLCPADERCDMPAEERGEAWGFRFVDMFGVDEPIKYGVRTSYALNMHMSRNFVEDRFEDASRQVYAMDGWWSWFANMNAAWAVYEQVTGQTPPDPVLFPHWEGTMSAWRHGPDFSANVLYLDGHVARVTPLIPDDPNDLLTDTVDTMQSFTWLPGERNIRFDWDAYDGDVPDYLGREPYWRDPEPGTYKQVAGTVMPIDYPESLSCSYRTRNRLWEKLGNYDRDRR